MHHLLGDVMNLIDELSTQLHECMDTLAAAAAWVRWSGSAQRRLQKVLLSVSDVTLRYNKAMQKLGPTSAALAAPTDMDGAVDMDDGDHEEMVRRMPIFLSPRTLVPS